MSEVKPKLPVNTATKSTVIVMVALILSKLTGQLREMLIPSKIGFGMLSDAFILGFLIPDLVYQLLVGGSIQAAITPTLSGAIYKNEEKKTWKSVSIFINITAAIMLFAVLAGELLIPVLLPLVSGEKSVEAVNLAISVSRALFPQVFFMMLAALSIGVLNAYKKFTAASMGPVVYNLCVVASMLIFGNKTTEGVQRVAIGVLFSAMIYFLMQFFFARRQFANYSLSFNVKNKGFQRLVRLAVPTLISASIVQLNLIILAGFTNMYDDGSLTALRFATTTWQLPYGVFAVAVGSVMLPTISGHFATHKHKSFSKVMTYSMRSALFLVIPSALIFAMLSNEVIRGIFQWGSENISKENINITATMLRWYCIAMICHSVIYLLNMSFYAAGKTKYPMINGGVTLITNTAFCIILTKFTSFGVISMPMAYTFSSIISVCLLYAIFKNKLRSCAPRGILKYSLQSILCLLGAALVLWIINLTGWDSPNKIIQLIILGLKGMAGMTSYVIIALFLRMREPILLLKKLVNKIQTR